MNSILLVEDGRVYQKSAAVLRIFKHLRGPWPLLYPTRHLPVSIRDAIYKLIADNRYKWFGKKDHCTMMIPAYKNRFI